MLGIAKISKWPTPEYCPDWTKNLVAGIPSIFFVLILLAQALKNELAEAQGAIVNVTSIGGSRVHPFAGAAYATSKSALTTLTKEMASDFGHFGVRVNAIAPGKEKQIY